jgi:UDP-glucose 4-epimerase
LQCDLRDRTALSTVFSNGKFETVIHFAGYKAVGESKQKPMLYYDNNVAAAVNLIQVMNDHNCKSIIFSSSCTVYGGSDSPLTETSTIGAGITNAYARSKFIIEEMLRDLQSADKSWKVCILRYFNPVGAHSSGLIGEDPRGIPNCLMPYILQVLVGRRDQLTVYGSDYETRDGTPIRDYIHVVDVAQGHLDAMTWMQKQSGEVCDAFNFGTGRGVSVFELIAAMEKASGKKVPYVVGERRAGDLTQSFCDPSKVSRQRKLDAQKCYR